MKHILFLIAVGLIFSGGYLLALVGLHSLAPERKVVVLAAAIGFPVMLLLAYAATGIYVFH